MCSKEEINEKSHKHTHHGHSCGCSCGGHGHSHDTEQVQNCGSCHSTKEQGPINLSREELEILLELKEFNYLPISEFIMSNSENHHIEFSSLAPVYIRDLKDTMETVRSIGSILKELEKKGLITLDYDIPLQGYDYTMHTESELYKYFIKTVEEGKNTPGFLCDRGDIEFGSAALTPLGESVVKSIHVEED
ncbi:hypothetical protein [Aminipila terrae]|uniref:Uncharacterized protein n=1 Tax=Aminipila terrae TaxID=2697030 RepID=A0A6P1MG39_9FIRM|nr:hypothetical protein [Aminipila terrae]QHI73669.1 hypothetical protein Ami3637_15945 [Aminipila terrae]